MNKKYIYVKSNDGNPIQMIDVSCINYICKSGSNYISMIVNGCMVNLQYGSEEERNSQFNNYIKCMEEAEERK